MFFIVAYFITVKLSNLYVISSIKLLTIRYLYQHFVFRGTLKEIKKSLPKISKLDSIKTNNASYFKNVNELLNNKNAREGLEFFFKYEDKIIPQTNKVKDLAIDIENQKKIKRDHEIKNMLITRKSEIVKENKNNLLLLGLLCSFLAIAGLVISIIGFRQWYIMVQRPLDQKIRLEIEELRKKNN